MKSRFLPAISCAAILVLAACNATTTVVPESDDGTAPSVGMPVPGTDTPEKEVSSDATSATSSDVSKPGMSGEARVITVTADNWSFAPNAISIKKGEKVTLRIQGAAGTHGVAVPGLGINTTVAAGKTVDIDLVTDVAGSFPFFCSVPCGPGHQDMKGTITITE